MMPPTTAETAPAGLEYLEQTLRQLGLFYFWPNNGNLGDYLIAEATRQLFRKWGLEWQEYRTDAPPHDEQYTVVYGGGGRFVPHWGGMDIFQEHLTRPQVKRCVILPHSIHGVDEFVSALDERHTVFCRERKTLAYCQSINTKAEILLAHDMGLYLDVEKLPGLYRVQPLNEFSDTESRHQYELLTQGMVPYIFHRIQRSAVRFAQATRGIAFVLRTDKEKSACLESEYAYDLSIVYSASCRETPYSAQLVRMMADVLTLPDVVVTDRLHVAIMAMHLGKEVYMLDNDYGKLSGVYEVSLKDKANVHLLPAGEPWPVALRWAWWWLNSPWRSRYFELRAWARRMLNSLR